MAIISNLSSIISEKCVVTPQFSLWILIALAKICFFRSHKPHKNIVVLAGHLTGCGGADPHNSLTSASSAF